MDMAFLNPDKGAGLPDAPTYDLILTVDAVHDMTRPDQVMPLISKVSPRREAAGLRGNSLWSSGQIAVACPPAQRGLALKLAPNRRVPSGNPGA